MPHFKKDKLTLFKALHELVQENIEFSHIQDAFEVDVAEFLTDLKNKRRLRKLKDMKKMLGIFIDEEIINQKNRLKDQKEYEIRRRQSLEGVRGYTNLDQ